MTTTVLLAGAFRVNEENSIRALIPSLSTMSQVTIYGGALTMVALGVLVWAIVFRHRRHHGLHGHHHRRRSFSKHRRLPETLPRHRTLAEVGGLPPIRNQLAPPFSV
jgi:hypothetical protein